LVNSPTAQSLGRWLQPYEHFNHYDNNKDRLQMKLKHTHAFIFLILLILTVFSQYNTGFEATPGWHAVIYPPKYLIQMGFVILSLLFAIIGYTILTVKSADISLKSFIFHFIFTAPLVVALLFPMQSISVPPMSEAEVQNILTQTEWMERILFSLFAIGLLVFMVNFIRSFKSRSSAK